MADSTPAAKKAATKQEDKEQAEAEKTAEAFKGPDVEPEPDRTDAQFAAESLKRDQEKAKQLQAEADVKAEQDAELEEVRALHREQRDRALARAEVSGSFEGVNHDDGKDGPQLRVYTADRQLHIETDGPVVLNADGVNALRQKMDAAFQAVN